MVGVGLAFAVLDLTGSVADLGWVLAARSVPLVLFLLVGGVVADRLPRRTVLLVTDAARAVTQGALGILLVTGDAQLWEVVVLQLFTGAATAFFMPASSALTTEVLPAERFQEANALRSLTNSAAGIAGPAIAGILVATAGPGWTLTIDGASFAVGAVFLVGVRPPKREPSPAQSMLGDLRDGWQAYWTRTWLVVGNTHFALLNAFVLAPFLVLGPAVAKRDLGGPGAWAAIATCVGVGYVAGSAAAIRLRFKRQLQASILGSALCAPPVALLALHAPVVVIAPFAVLTGMQLTICNTLWETTLQELIPAELLSRVVAYDWLNAIVFQPVGFALSGLIAAHVLGVAGTLWAAAGLAVASSTIV
ncbi:MAG: hypothetical protein QOF76_5656, partial [Solirubrobacteraceae bacterium]|nr:hypothetical protein [Solirubrobacteraceae bacterium]